MKSLYITKTTTISTTGKTIEKRKDKIQRIEIADNSKNEATEFIIKFARKKLKKLQNEGEWGVEWYIPTIYAENAEDIFNLAKIIFSQLGTEELKTYQYKFQIKD